MTLLEHVRFTFTLRFRTDAHIGSGETRRLSELRPSPARRTNAEDTDPEVAVLVRDHAGLPTVPGTALKGALRKAAEPGCSDEDVARLFGKIGFEDSDAAEDEAETEDDPSSWTKGIMGRFSVYAAEWQDDEGSHDDLPLWCPDQKSWIATHVAIARETGAADPKKLYTVEMLPAGTWFRVDGVWFGTEMEARAGLQTLLAPLASADGLALGAGHRLGGGTAHLGNDNVVTLTEVTRFDPETGAVATATPEPLKIAPPTAHALAAKLSLACEGPFLSVDSAPRRDGDNRANVIHALRRNDQTPVLHMETVAGALRQRAAWLAAVHGLGDDDRFRKPKTWTTPDDLSPVERLFGVTGWRGLLRLVPPAGIAGTRSPELVSIAIDRFTGAVLDGTVFEHEVFTDVSLTIGLVWDARLDADSASPVTDDDRRLLDLLLDDLDGDTLPLGHATNRGFGWFTVTVARSGGPA